MQLNLLKRTGDARLSPAAAGILLALSITGFLAAGILSLPRGEGADSAVHISDRQLMTGCDSTTDPLEYAELLPGLKININTADKHALSLLPGIDDNLAQAIIEYREANGAFEAAKDVMKIYGIGEGTFEKIKDLITTGE